MFALRARRKTLQKTIDQVAEDTGISSSVISRIETGKQLPSREDARTLFKYFDQQVPLAAIYDPEYFENV
jgi:transcriptional regulator with XRE-family HTH domain